MYISLLFGELRVAALADTGSSINVISKSLFDSISDHYKISFEQLLDAQIRLANNEKIQIYGIVKLRTVIHQKEEEIDAYILPKTSHPFIIGTAYMRDHNIVLDFSSFSCNERTTQVKTTKRVDIEPNSECITFGKLPSYVTVGLQGICSNSKFALNHGLMIAKSLVVVPVNRKIPIKILNASNVTITIPKGKYLAEFSSLSDDYTYIPLPENSDTCIPEVQHMQVVNADNQDGTYIEEQTVKDINEVRKFLLSEAKNIEKIMQEFNFSEHLTENQKSELATCIHENYDLFVTKQNPNLGFTSLVEHEINLKPNAIGKHQQPYRLPPYKREILRQQLDDLLQQGIIAPVSETEELPITSPVVLVTKRNASSDKLSAQNFRFCCDFRFLNSQSEDFKYIIPNLQELTESFSDMVPNFISSIDLSQGFFQMGISSRSTPLTAFNTCFGTYKFLRLPMGLKTAPNTFQLLMDKVLHGLKFKTCLCYLDDVLICSATFEQHLADLREIFGRFRTAGLKLGPKKCHFAAQSCVFLGHEISKEGIKPPKDRVQAINDYPEPKNIKQLRRFIGMLNWFKKFIPRFSARINPLTKLLKKNQKFIWKNEQSVAFEDLKICLANSEVLSFPCFDLPFILAVDTSSRGIGYMLYQKEENSEKPKIIRFGSKSLTVWQQSYGPTKLELLGMVTAILDCVDYLRGNKFIVECDHQALQPLFQKKFKGAIYERWLAILQQFSFEIRYKPAEQMKVADALSRCENPNNVDVESPAEDDPFFPYVEEPISEIKMPGGIEFANLFEIHGNRDDNVQAISLVNDSDSNFDPYDADTDEPDESQSSGNKRKYKIVTGKSRKRKDINDLTNLKSKIDLDTSNIKELQREDDEIKQMIQYLENGELPISQKDSRRILIQSGDFVLVDDVLYHQRRAKSKRTKSLNSFQLVIPKVMIPQILKIAHDSPLAGHSGIQNTLDYVREHFFFTGMGKIVSDYVQSCQDCQARKVSTCKTKAKITPYATPTGPFEVWQMDMFGPLVPSNNGNRYVFTAVDMFSNFLFSLPLRNIDALSVSEAIFTLFSHYGVCKTLISDQGSEFISKCTTEVCKLLDVAQDFSPSMIHHCLGRCERTHRTLAEHMTPFILKNQQWEDMLPSITFSINSCVNPSTGYSAFEIIFGKRPVFPLTLANTVNFKDIPKDTHAYFQNLTNRLKFIHEQVKSNVSKAQHKMQECCNEKVHELHLSVGDYVYMQREPVGQGQKFQPIYDGPFVVTTLDSEHMVYLRDPAGKRNFRKAVHVNRLKLAHVRMPFPDNYFRPSEDDESENIGHTSQSVSDSDKDLTIHTEEDKIHSEGIRETDNNATIEIRPKRNIRKPSRYRDDDYVNPDNLSDLSQQETTTNDGFKIKRILAKRKDGGSFRYLVQKSGEPAQNAVWLPGSKLPPKAHDMILRRPPPLID